MARDLSGQVLDGRYRIIEPIGKGAMGSVYRGEHLKLGRAVAIKVINEHVDKAMASRRRFDREARAMAKLEHPHCASVLDVGLHDDMPFVVMDFVSGQNLLELVTQEGPLPIPRALEIMRQLLSGLGHAHEHGIIHRDIKPANIVLSQKSGLGDQVKILDFGLAKMNQETSNITAGIVVGTPSYMAPEQILGQLLDVRVDVYACGIVLFEILTGQKPFKSANNEPIEICMQHINVPPPRLRDALPGHDFGALEEIVEKALAKPRDDRYASAAEFAAAIATVSGRTAQPTPPRGMPAARTSGIKTPVPSGIAATMPFAPAPNAAQPAPQSSKRTLVTAAVFAGVAVAILAVGIATRSKKPAKVPTAPQQVMIAAQQPLIVPPSAAADDAVAALLAKAKEMAGKGQREAAIDLLTKARKTYRDDARLPYHAGLLYLDKMWWGEALKQFRATFALDAKYKSDPAIIKGVLRGFNTTARYDSMLAGFLRNEVGAPAKPYLEEVARAHPNVIVRKRAAAELRRY